VSELTALTSVSLRDTYLLSSGVSRALRLAGDFPRETFLDLVRDKAKRQCMNRAFKDLTDKDFHDFVESIWDRNLRTISFPCRESVNFLLPVTFLGLQARRQPWVARPESLHMTFTA
jgi:hypothetical protein